MKEKPLEHKKNKGPSVESILEPQFITECPKCGGEVGLWSKDQETVCVFCDHKVFEKERTEH